MRKSSVLLLGICSNHKADPATRRYDAGGALHSLLPSDKAKWLMEQRGTMYSVLRGSMRGLHWVGGLRDNLDLDKRGQDLGGRGSLSKYLPAVQLYEGRFYEALGSDRLDVVRRSCHHFLIISGLYGLVNATECIQPYDLALSDYQATLRAWGSSEALTDLLVAYVRKHGIQLILELTALSSYRALVDWYLLKSDAKVEVLHAFCKEHAGDDALPALGKLARHLLKMGEKDLLHLHRGYRWRPSPDGELVELTGTDTPPDEFAAEPDPSSSVSQHGSGTLPPVRADLPMSKGKHINTIFGPCAIRNISDLPKGAQELFENLSRAEYVIGVRLGRFTVRGRRAKRYQLKLQRPVRGAGVIKGYLQGPGKLAGGGIQRVTVMVVRGRERWVWQQLTSLCERISAA